MNGIDRRRFLVSALGAAFVPSLVASRPTWAQAGGSGRPRRILHVMSFDSPWRWTDGQFSGFKEGLGDIGAEFRVFQMDVKHHSSREARERKGQEARVLIEAIRQSFVPNPEWELAMAKHNNAIAGEALRETQKRAAIWREANDYISKLRQDTYAARQRSEDYIARERGKGIRGVEEYADSGASGGTVELSSYYDHAFALRDGGGRVDVGDILLAGAVPDAAVAGCAGWVCFCQPSHSITMEKENTRRRIRRRVSIGVRSGIRGEWGMRRREQARVPRSGAQPSAPQGTGS